MDDIKLYSKCEDYTLFNGDMLNMGEVIENNSIDSIVCDPPYLLNFMGKDWDKTQISVEPDTWKKCYDALKPGGYLLAFGGSRTFHRIACAIEDAGFEIRDTIIWIYSSGFPKSMNIGKKIAEYNGWGSALKPAHEDIIVARKPFKGSLIDNVRRFGVGGLNIDECRVETGEKIAKNVGYKDEKQADGWGTKRCITEMSTQGRFPANVIHDGSEEVCAGFPDNGRAARYFYCAKPSKKDRDEGLPDGTHSTHPTVKPTSLMQYLVKLVTPKGGIVLDPFMGSGSTGKAVMYENNERDAKYKFVGIELSEEYMKIAEARIAYARKKGDK